MGELIKRIVFAVPAAALFLYVTWIGQLYFAGLVVLITLFIQRELAMLMDRAGYKADDYFPYTIGLLILLSPYLANLQLLFLIVFLLFIGIQLFKSGDRGITEMIPSFFSGVYAPAGLLCLILIRNMDTHETGFVLTLTLLLMVWGNDVFAYFGGKQFGKRLMAPNISPGKTWEGFLFGILGAITGLLIVYYLVPIPLPASLVLLLPATLLISIFGPIGDLTESRLKRAAGAKDSAGILPGHGGFFDRFDALILAAPAFYSYLELMKIMSYV